MTPLMQELVAGAIVVTALGHLLWRLHLRALGWRQAKAASCSTCDSCRGCKPPPQPALQLSATREHPAR